MKKEDVVGKAIRRVAIILILLLIVLGSAIYFSFFFVDECADFGCFQKKMEECKRSKYLNEREEASWLYEIKGKDGKMCAIEVKLLQTKKGSLEIEDLSGLEMICKYPRGIWAYPESDLSKCSGVLKEELQNVIIKKLHSYIIENLGTIDESLTSAV